MKYRNYPMEILKNVLEFTAKSSFCLVEQFGQAS